jgi:hypothetical protein
LKAAEGFSETSEQLFAQLREELNLHAHAEEQVLYSALQEAEKTRESAWRGWLRVPFFTRMIGREG